VHHNNNDANNTDANYMSSRMSVFRRIFAAIFVLSFALDFKGNVGGTVIQFVMAGLNAFAFILLAASYRFRSPRSLLPATVLWGWLIFVITGTMGALANFVPLSSYVRIVYPFVLFIEGYMVAWWIGKSNNGSQVLVSTIYTASAISLFFTLMWGFAFTGISVTDIRYQILSPLIPMLIVVLAYDLFFAQRRKLISLLMLVFIFYIIALSVTRGMILALMFLLLTVLLGWLQNALARPVALPRSFIRFLIIGSFTILCGLASATYVVRSVIVRWSNRSFGAGEYVTLWTRIAAVLGQYQAMMSSKYGWILGQGFGSSYPWPVWKFPWILPYLNKNFLTDASFPGEFMWMSFIYYGGVIVGFIIIVLLLTTFRYCYRILRSQLKQKTWLQASARPLWIGLLGYFAFIGLGFTSDPLGARNASLFMGLCLGLVFARGRLITKERT